jgi:hypothetical protein
MMDQTTRDDKSRKVTEGRSITNMEVYTLMEAIILSSEFKITREGKLLDIFLTKRPVRRRKNTSIMLRMIHMLPSDLECVKFLREHLIKFASFKGGQDMTVRQVEFMWANKLIDIVKNMTKRTHIESPKMLKLLADLNDAHDYRYIFGNIAVGNQLNKWLAMEKQREELLMEGEVNTDMTGWLKAQKERLALAVTRKPEVENEAGIEAELHEVDEDLDETDEPEPTVLTRADTAQQLRIGELTMEVPANTNIKLTPIKQYTGKRVMWKDYMKVQILEKYIDMAADPLKRPSSDKPKSKAVYKDNIGDDGEIYNSTIMYMGEKTSLPSLCQPDTLHQFFGFKGLTGQKDWVGTGTGTGLGLAALIDYVMHGKEQSKAVLMENKYEIMNLATLLSSDT